MMIILGTVYSNIQDKLNTLGNPWATVQSLNTLVPALLGVALVIGVVVFMFMLLVGGIKWITAGGDKNAMESAQKILSSAIIGLVILFCVWAIKNLVFSFFKL